MDFVVDDLEAERLIKSGRETLPGNVLEVVVEPAHAPDVPVNSGNCSVAIVEEIVAASEEKRVPFVFVGNGDGIDGERILAAIEVTFSDECGAPARGTAFGKGRE